MTDNIDETRTMDATWHLEFTTKSEYKMRFIGNINGELWKDEERTDSYTFKDGKGMITQLGETMPFEVEGEKLTITIPETEPLVFTKKQ